MPVKDLLEEYFPRRWFLHGGINFDRLLTVLSIALQKSVESGEKANTEIFVKSAIESLSEKEKILGLPSGESIVLAERRNRIIAREYERGGPTNTEEFELALTMLTGSPTKVVPDYSNFVVTYEIEDNGNLINLMNAEDYIRRNKLAHLRHFQAPKVKVDTIQLSTSVRSFEVDYLICGTFYPEDDVEGRIYSENIAVAEAARYHTVMYQATNTFYPTPE